MGDACDDRDGDGLFDYVDNCPAVANASQLDTAFQAIAKQVGELRVVQ